LRGAVARFLAVSLIALGVWLVPRAEAGLDPRLGLILEGLRPGGEVSVIVTFADQGVLDRFRKDARTLRSLPADSRRQHRQALVNALKDASLSASAPLQGFLRARGARSITPLWIANALEVTAGRKVVEAAAAWPGVSNVTLNGTTRLPAYAVALEGAPEWNLAAIRAPELWSRGFTGQGVVIATLDSGVDVLHADLGPKWRGGANSWFDPYGEHPDLPYDRDGHGTAVAGILVGGSAGGTAVGVAPDARWIAAKIFNDAGVADDLRVHQAFQWLLDPDGDPATDDAPDLVNNSWGLEDLPGACVSVFQPDVEALKAAGIAVVFSAGNTGGLPGTSVSPANYTGSFAAGAVDQAGVVPSFSARGPSACDGAMFPEVVAPGLNIRTADLTLGGTFPAASVTVSGTSFSAPHVAGAMALLLSALPGEPVIALEAALQQTATDLGPTGPDNASGSGRIDAVAAYEFLNVPAGAPRIAVLPSASFVGFGAVTVNQTAGRAFSVVNVGSAGLAIDAIAIDGTDAAEFSLRDDFCSNRELTPAAACTFEAAFSPLTSGRKGAGIVIPSNDPATPQVRVLLSGNDLARIGSFRGGAWYLDDGNRAWNSGIDIAYPSFGVPGDIPVTGDWDGDGRTEIGVYRRGIWYLDNGNGRWDPDTDLVYRNFGAPADIPVTGDWDGDGRTEIGTYRRGTWYLDNGNGQWDPDADLVYRSFGAPQDIPVTGDWDGDRRTEIGTYRQGTWYLDNGNGQWDPDADTVHQSFGAPQNIPVTGDWDGDGRTDVGTYRRGTWYLDNGNGRWDPGIDAVHTTFGASDDIPLVGRWH